MGLLTVGKPLTWDEALKRGYLDYVREHGVTQFINNYNRVKDIRGDELLYGDELEYHVLKVDPDTRTVKLSLRGTEIMEQLQAQEQSRGAASRDGCSWHPEYGSWMVESTPRAPYAGYTADLRAIEVNMRLRRQRLMAALAPDEICPTVTTFPMLGVGDFVHPAPPAADATHGPVADSDYVPDSIINPHPRFAALTRNIRSRRGSKVDIRVPLYPDSLTPETTSAEGARKRRAMSLGGDVAMEFVDSVSGEAAGASAGGKEPEQEQEQHDEGEQPCGDECVHMDAMAFGMGSCCLQVTFQAQHVNESRHLFDQLAVLAPIMLALTAATPIYKGRLVDTDVRWAVIAASVDDRTAAERGLAGAADAAPVEGMANGGVQRLSKSRYDSISTFICGCNAGRDPHTSTSKYNDVPCEVHQPTYDRLIESGIDSVLARHVAHLFVRDPLVVFEDRVEVDDEREVDHFESIQSTNWQTVRWKPPPAPRESIGWRTEFRSMEIQLTDFENAAFTVFVVLVSRVILAFDLNLYVPLSLVDANMHTAHLRDAVRRERFHFRKHMAPPEDGDCSHAGQCEVHADHDGSEQMTILEILTGKGRHFPGLVPLIYAYLEHVGADRATRAKVQEYMSFIIKRASGELMTAAAWIRDFVTTHEEYQRDSVVTQGIAYDLMQECRLIGEGAVAAPSLLGDFRIEPIHAEDAYDVALTSGKLDTERQRALLQRYSGRSSFLSRTAAAAGATGGGSSAKRARR